MAYYTLYFNNFNNKNNYNKYFINLKEDTFIFTIRWNFYNNTAYLSISDFEDKPIITGKALVNGLKIRHNKLPYVLYFMQQDGKSYEPTLKNLSKNFVLIYNDEELVI